MDVRVAHRVDDEETDWVFVAALIVRCGGRGVFLASDDGVGGNEGRLEGLSMRP